jgi:phosphoribosylglycinamide formyltransferase-1
MKAAQKLPIGVLVSGNGTNLQAIIDACEAKRLARASRHKIPAAVVLRAPFPSKEAFEARIVQELSQRGVELVCLAGFMRIIGTTLLTAFPQRILNIHPALLPAFPGLHAQHQAVEYGVKVAGCTVHFVDERTDHGPIISQAAVEVREDDTAESLAARILEEEHRLYPAAIQLYAEGRLRIEGRRVFVKGNA